MIANIHHALIAAAIGLGFGSLCACNPYQESNRLAWKLLTGAFVCVVAACLVAP
jgi:hypothetical protein